MSTPRAESEAVPKHFLPKIQPWPKAEKREPWRSATPAESGAGRVQGTAAAQQERANRIGNLTLGPAQLGEPAQPTPLPPQRLQAGWCHLFERPAPCRQHGPTNHVLRFALKDGSSPSPATSPRGVSRPSQDVATPSLYHPDTPPPSRRPSRQICAIVVDRSKTDEPPRS